MGGFALLLLVACDSPGQMVWADTPGQIITPPSACVIWGAWRVGPSPLTEGRTVVEFIEMSVNHQPASVRGHRLEVDCATNGYRMLGQADYGHIGQEGPLGETRPMADLSKLNPDLSSGRLATQIAEACRLRNPTQPPDFSSLNEFVEAAGKIPDDYFDGKRCVVIEAQPRIVRPGSRG